MLCLACRVPYLPRRLVSGVGRIFHAAEGASKPACARDPPCTERPTGAMMLNFVASASKHLEMLSMRCTPSFGFALILPSFKPLSISTRRVRTIPSLKPVSRSSMLSSGSWRQWFTHRTNTAASTSSSRGELILALLSTSPLLTTTFDRAHNQQLRWILLCRPPNRPRQSQHFFAQNAKIEKTFRTTDHLSNRIVQPCQPHADHSMW